MHTYNYSVLFSLETLNVYWDSLPIRGGPLFLYMCTRTESLETHSVCWTEQVLNRDILEVVPEEQQAERGVLRLGKQTER